MIPSHEHTGVAESKTAVAQANSSAGLGFELDDEAWIARLRASTVPPGLGRFGPYELLEEIGRGGQGLVYRARQPGTGRCMAIKRLSAGVFSTPAMRARFEREIEAAAGLEHPNIVTVYGSEMIDGQSVLVMQWVDGIPIDQWAIEGTGASAPPPHASRTARERHTSGFAPIADHNRRGVREILELFVQVCDAIQHAHGRGVLHRDIKPGNILVDREDRPHVLDFGLAKVRQDSAGDVNLTATGAFFGTPAYAAPEQLRGERTLDVRTDVYSLGAVLYEALTGRTVLDPSLTFGARVKAFETLAPTPPSKFNSTCNREVDAMVLKALQPGRNGRYSSVEALGADLQRYLAGAPVLAHPPSISYRAGKFIRRHSISSTLAAITFAMLVILVFVSRTQAARERDLRGQAQAQERIATHEAELQRDTNEFLLTIFRRIALNSTARPRILTSALAGWIEEPLLNGRFHPSSDVCLEVHQLLGSMMRDAGKKNSELVHRRRTVELAASLYGNDDPRTWAESVALARALGACDEAEQVATTAYEAIKRLPESTPLQCADAVNGLAEVLVRRGKRDEAVRLLAQTIDAQRRAGSDAAARMIILRALARVFDRSGRYMEARDLLQESLTVLEAGGLANGKMEWAVHEDLSSVEYCMDHFDEAEHHAARAAISREQNHGLHHSRTAGSYGKLARALHALGRYTEAVTALEKALVFYDSGEGDVVARVRFQHGAALLAAGRNDEGRRQLLRAVSKGKSTQPGIPEFDDLAECAESAIRDNAFRLNDELRQRLGSALAWLIVDERILPGSRAERTFSMPVRDRAYSND